MEKLHREAAKAIQAPEVQARFATLGVDPLPMTLEEFAAFFREDVAAVAGPGEGRQYSTAIARTLLVVDWPPMTLAQFEALLR